MREGNHMNATVWSAQLVVPEFRSVRCDWDFPSLSTVLSGAMSPPIGVDG